MSHQYLFGKRQTLIVFTLFCVLMVFDFADRMVIAALLPQIKSEWQLTDAQSGLFGSVLYLGMVIFALPASYVIQRWSRTKTAGLMGVLWSLSSMLGALARTPSELTVTRALVGIGEAGYAPAAYAWISAAFPRRRRQLALGVFSACQAVGMAVGLVIGGYIAARFGWRHAIGILAIPGILIAILLYHGKDYRIVLNDATPETQAQSERITAGFRRILSTRSLLCAYFISAMGILQSVPVNYFLPSYLQRTHGLDISQASLLSSGLMVVSIFSVPFGGWLMDKLNDQPVLKLKYALLVISFATFIYGIAFSDNFELPLQYLLILLAALVSATTGIAILNMTQELIAPPLRALSGTCLIIVLHLLGSAPAPYFTGLLSDLFGLGKALQIMVISSGLLAILGIIVARFYYLKDLSRVEQVQLIPA